MRKVLGMVVASVLMASGWVAFGVSQFDADDREQRGLIDGSYVAWSAINECALGPVECDAALKEGNDFLKPKGLLVMEDGSVWYR